MVGDAVPQSVDLPEKQPWLVPELYDLTSSKTTKLLAIPEQPVHSAGSGTYQVGTLS